MSGRDHIDVHAFTYEDRAVAKIRAGHLGTERIVPPAGEDHAFTRDRWRHVIEINVSPTGRSVRLFVDGRAVPLGALHDQEEPSR